jgi:hypothetical protein
MTLDGFARTTRFHDDKQQERLRGAMPMVAAAFPDDWERSIPP